MNKFTYQEVVDASRDYFGGEQLPAEVFATKYALRDNEGNLLELTPTDMHRRLAKEFARIEASYVDDPEQLSEEEIFNLLSDWTIIPQGSPMSAIGNLYQIQSLSNCFVIASPHDSYGGIMKADQEQAQIMKRRGGVGFNISTIRPKGVRTSNAARTTDGIGVFMERFSNTCREVAQGGRRGALMLVGSIKYPDIDTFISIKKDRSKVTGANISVQLNDEFMIAVKNNLEFTQQFPVDSDNPIITKKVDANKLWDDIITSAHDSAEPGLLFWDTILRRTPSDAYASLGFRTIATNPCAELVLCAYDSCRLLLVNLEKFVIDPFLPTAKFDYEAFSKAAKKAQRLMDDLVDLELEAVDRIIEKIKADLEPEDVKRLELDLWNKIKVKATQGRRTGLGITALGDTLAQIGVKYGSDESIVEVEKIYKTLALSSWSSSIHLAKHRGAFPIYDASLEKGHEFIEQILNADLTLKAEHEKYGRRNIAITTTAPAGSTSICSQTTSGVEPVFMLNYKRNKKINANDDSVTPDFVDEQGDKWKQFDVYHHGLKKWMKVTGESDITKSPYYGATANDVDWVKRVDLQAAAQKWICHSISVTINLPKDVSVETVKQIYMRGWESGCKGITIYRDGCRNGVLVSSDDKSTKSELTNTSHAEPRKKELECDIHRVNVKGDSYVVFIGLNNGKPYEVFAGLANQVDALPKKAKKGILIKNGKKDNVTTYNLRITDDNGNSKVLNDIVNQFDNPVHGAFTRTLSLSLRHGIPVQFLVEQLRKDKHSDITSFSSVIARVLSKSYITDGTKATQEKTCENCGSTNLAYQEGCPTCVDCSFSKCA